MAEVEGGSPGPGRHRRGGHPRWALLVSAVRWRGRSAVAMFVIAVVAAGAAALGPLYLRSVDQTVLSSTLTQAFAPNVGITVQPAVALVVARVPKPAHGRWYGAPITTRVTGFTTDVVPSFGSLVARTGECRDLRFSAGSCPARPRTVMVSTRTASFLHLKVGSSLPLAFVRSARRATVVVSGIYVPGNPAAPVWWGQNYFGFGTAAGSAKRVDDIFTSPATLRAVAPPDRVSSIVQFPFVARSLPLGQVGALQAAIKAYAADARTSGVSVSTQLTATLSQAAATEHTSATIVAVVVLQLVLLALFVLYFVANRTATEREADVRLAELRGFRQRSAMAVAMTEPAVLVAAAVPAGLLASWAVTSAVAPLVFGGGVGASLTPLAVGAAAGSGVLGVAATALGTRQALAHASPDAPARSAGRRRASTLRVVGDVAVVAVAAAAFYELAVGGFGKGSSSDSLAALAPGLLALALGLLGARILPLLLRATHGATANSRRVGAVLATRTVARRREFASQVVLVALAVGLATFAVSGWVVASRNRQARSQFGVGAAKVLTVSVRPGVTFLAAVRAADPRGRAAMAVVLERAANGTTLAVDASRLGTAAYWPATLGPSAVSVARELVPSHLSPPVEVSGTSVEVTVDVTTMRATPPPQLSMALFDPDFQAASEVTFGALHPGAHTYRASLTGGCPGGCRLVGVSLTWTRTGAGSATVTLSLDALRDHVHGAWRPVRASLDDSARWSGHTGITAQGVAGDGLALHASLNGLGTAATVEPTDVPTALPTVVTPATASTASGHGGPYVVGLDGGEVPGHTVARVAALPEVGRGALLVDLGTAERFVSGSFVTATTQVWAAPDAPRDLAARLAARGVTVVSVATAAAAAGGLAKSGVSLAYLLFLVCGGAACALAVGATGFALAAGARRREAELAALSATGVRGKSLGRFVRTEQWLVLGPGLVLGAAAGLAAAAVALRSIPEFASAGAGPPLDLGLPPGALAGTVAVVAIALGVVAASGATAVARAATVEKLGGGRLAGGRRAAARPAEVPPARPLPRLGGARRGEARGGVPVQLLGVVHLYRQSGADVVGLRSVDLDVEPGEMVALLGPSGMGKTTVLRLMAGLMTASAGIVKVGDQDLGRLRQPDRRRLRAGEISYVVQGTAGNVLPYATALQNVWFGQHGARTQGCVPPWTNEELLEVLGLDPVADERVAGLPRGLQQQVAVASGVAGGSRLLLADEPTAQLTTAAAEGVIELLHRINAEFGTTVVVVTHDHQVAARFPRTVTIRDGRVGSEAHHGEEYAVVDGSRSVQLPPDVLDVLPPYTRVKVVRTRYGVELRNPSLEP